MKLRGFLVSITLTIAVVFCVANFALATSPMWTQNDWTGGDGQVSWSDQTKYTSATNASTSVTGLTLSIRDHWYNIAWKYRQSVTTTNNSGDTLNNFQIPIYLNTAQLISDSKMKADCSDIRITDSDGVVLPQWIATAPLDNTCNQTATKIWVKLSSLPTSGATLYIYYGNADAVATSNGNNVFPIFADFTSGSSLPSGWTTTNIGTAGTASVGNGVLTISNTNGEDVWQTIYGATHVYNTSTVNGSFVAETLVNSQTNSETWAKTGITVQNTVAPNEENGHAFIVTTPGNGTAFQFQSLTGEMCEEGICQEGIVSPNEQINGGWVSFPMFLKLTKDTSNQVSGYFSFDGSDWSQRGNTITPLGAANDQYVTLFVTPHSINKTSTSTYSFFYIRNYTSSEPTVSTPQNEQSPYYSSSYLTSSIFDTGAGADFGVLSFSYINATNTTITVKIRTSNDPNMTTTSDFADCNSIASNEDISTNNCVTDRDRYVQYQVLLTSSDNLYSPTFQSFDLGYTLTPTHTLIYTSDNHGAITGSSTQVIYSGNSGTTVTATAFSGYKFSSWDDGATQNPRIDTGVTANLTVRAIFTKITTGGSFVAPTTPKVITPPSLVQDTINSNVSNVYQMAISDSKDFSHTSWEAYNESYKATNKILYIKFRSPEGGESAVYTIAPKITPVITTSSTSTRYYFTHDLKLGAKDNDVKELQKYLNTHGYIIDTDGIGSPGKESSVFGKLTRDALARFQKDKNIKPAMGYFGAITRNFTNNF